MGDQEKPWIKLWARWYETMSHGLLSPQALHTGPYLLTVAAKYGRRDDGTAWLVGPRGDALTVARLAKGARWPTRTMGEILAELCDAGTLAPPGDAYHFPRFRRWQEGSSTERVRRFRGVTVTPGVTVLERPMLESRKQKAEVELTPLPPGGDAWVEVAHVCDRLPWVSPEGLPVLLSPRDRIHRVVTSGATADEILAVLAGFAAAVLAGKERREHWNAQYVFSGHYDRLRTQYASGAAPEAETPQETLRRLKGGAG